jgi:putative zinc finger protein
MIRHLTTEQLSSYLDGEVASHEAREIEGHLASCDECRGFFKSMQRTISEVWHLGRIAPPPGLATRVRAEVAAARQPEPSFLRNLAGLVFGVPNRPVLRTASAMGLALVLTLFLFTNGFERKSSLQDSMAVLPPPMVEVVKVEPVFGPLVLPQTTSQVAGREFVWNELISGDVWVQRGLEGKIPEERLSAESPQGRELLKEYSELGLLISDGSRVVLRYRLETVELSQGV